MDWLSIAIAVAVVAAYVLLLWYTWRRRSSLWQQITQELRDVFISYRRSDTEPMAMRFYNRLMQAFGQDRVFIDHEVIEGGAELDEIIKVRLLRSNCVYVLIGENWYSERLRDPNDWVRQEIKLAMDSGKYVVPVLVNDATMPSEEKLQKVKLERLRKFAGKPLNDNTDFDKQCEALVRIAKERAAVTPLTRELVRTDMVSLATLALPMLFVLLALLLLFKHQLNASLAAHQEDEKAQFSKVDEEFSRVNERLKETQALFDEKVLPLDFDELVAARKVFSDEAWLKEHIKDLRFQTDARINTVVEQSGWVILDSLSNRANKLTLMKCPKELLDLCKRRGPGTMVRIRGRIIQVRDSDIIMTPESIYPLAPGTD